MTENRDDADGGYVILRYRSEEEKELLKHLVVDGGLELVKKVQELQEDQDEGKDGEGVFSEWGSDYAGKSSEGVYQFING